MSNAAPHQGDTNPAVSATARKTDGHQDVGGQNETIPQPQLDLSSIDVSDIEERPAPAGGDDDAIS